ncbi:hypothetical protein F5B21DRAFT_524675 [Xylaria acuta]|nr:hypothetical protein F5B21DRAFT_524675 [Xylaria acuta]
MSPEQRENTPIPTELFHDALTELLAKLAISSFNDPQQKPPSGSINKTSVIKQFESSSGLISDFAEEFGVSLPDVLWAFSLIFSPSRSGGYVVASVLGEQEQAQDTKKSLFTLYLTMNKGTWSSDDTKYREKWQDAVNCAVNGTMPDSSDLWSSLTQHCKERIESYAESVGETVLGVIKEPKEPNPSLKKSCTETRDDIAKWARLVKPTEFPVALKVLLENIEQDWNYVDALTSLTEKCWEFLNDHGDNFQDLFAKLPERSSAPIYIGPVRWTHGGRARLFLKTIENFAKLPRAWMTCLKFLNVLVSKKALFKIQLLPYLSIKQANKHAQANCHGRANRSRMLLDSSIIAVKSKISQLTKPNVLEAEEIIMERKNHNPRCEIQLLQYFYHKDKPGVWNVIGCSKRQCLACSALLRASDFLFEEGHGKAYFQQLLSIEGWLENDKDMASAITTLNQELTKTITEYNLIKKTRYVEPDSPICQDWSPNTLRNLHISEERNLFRPKNIQAPTLPQEPSQPNVPMCLHSQWEDHSQTERMKDSLRPLPEGLHSPVNANIVRKKCFYTRNRKRATHSK